MRFTPYDIQELMRMASDLKQRGYNDLAYEIETSTIAVEVTITEFDKVKSLYREWLNTGHSVYPNINPKLMELQS